MIRLAFVVLLAGCVHGAPFDPEDICADVTIGVHFETKGDSTVVVTDSIRYEDCER